MWNDLSQNSAYDAVSAFPIVEFWVCVRWVELEGSCSFLLSARVKIGWRSEDRGQLGKMSDTLKKYFYFLEVIKHCWMTLWTRKWQAMFVNCNAWRILSAASRVGLVGSVAKANQYWYYKFSFRWSDVSWTLQQISVLLYMIPGYTM